jgi:hypothetical protein
MRRPVNGLVKKKSKVKEVIRVCVCVCERERERCVHGTTVAVLQNAGGYEAVTS